MNDRQSVMVQADTKEAFRETRRLLSLVDGVDYTDDQAVARMVEITKDVVTKQIQETSRVAA